jgi:hypothetical protein
MLSSNLPTFFIIGAPKCGTTSLAHWLAQHSRVFVSPYKEPHHYNTDMRHQIFKDRKAYENLFSKATANHLAIGEASVWYLYSRDAVSNIEAINQSARYIVCLRNPIDMYQSLHMQQLFSGNEIEQNPEKAWHLSIERKCGINIPANAIDPLTLIYHEACALGSQLERLYSYVPKDRVHVILLDDMAKSPDDVFDGVLRFLGLPADPGVLLLKQNEAKARRSAVLRKIVHSMGRTKQKLGITTEFGLLSQLELINTKKNPKIPLSPEFRAYLIDYFRSEIAILSRLLGTNLNFWNAE